MIASRTFRSAIRLAAALLLLAVASASVAADRLFLWEVRKAGQAVFLLGTVHFWKAEDYPLAAPIERAFAQARTLAVELDPSQPDARQAILRHAVYGPGDGLDRHLPSGLVEQAQQAAADLGLDGNFVLQAKPWLLASVLMAAAGMQAGYTPDAGIDAHLIARARAAGKRVVEIESVELQMAVFESMKPAEQALFVKQAVEVIRRGAAGAVFDTIARLWREGDTEGLEALERLGLENEPMAAAFMKRTIRDRNPAMADAVVRLLDAGDPALIAVGAAHLAGPDSVVDLLQRRGYSVRQVSADE